MVSRGPAGEEVYAVDGELRCDSFFRCFAEAVEAVDDPHVREPDLLKQSNHLCLRQSARDSTGPQVDIVSNILVQRHVHGDIGEEEPATRTQHARDLGVGFPLVRHKV